MWKPLARMGRTERRDWLLWRELEAMPHFNGRERTELFFSVVDPYGAIREHFVD